MSTAALSDLVGNRVMVEVGRERWVGALKDVQDDGFLVLDACEKRDEFGAVVVGARDGVRVKVARVDAIFPEGTA